MKLIYSLLALILVAVTLNRSCRDGERPFLYNPLPVILPEGINHLLDNSQSELEEMQAFDHVVERFMERWEITGASIAIMKNGRLLYSKGYGWADKEKSVRTDVKHIFRIASLSKLITATGIMKLQEDGLLSLGDPVFGEQGILCDSIFSDIRDKRVRKITVEHLLRHQGGYSIRAGDPLFCSLGVARQLGIPAPVGLDDMVRYASQTRLRYEPGGSNVYSNLGYVVLTKVIEKVSGMPYEKFIQDSILAPVGCRDMHIGYSLYEKKFPNEVHYYEPSDTEPAELYDGSGQLVPKCYGGCDMQVLSGAGGWVASPTELMKFITAIDPDDSKPDILTPRSIAYMTEKDKSKYPIGWMKTTANDDWSRTGSLSGSSALLKRQHDGYSWVLITNTSSWSGSHFTRKISAMMKQAMGKVKTWPDRDLFVVEQQADSARAAALSQQQPLRGTPSGRLGKFPMHRQVDSGRVPKPGAPVF